MVNSLQETVELMDSSDYKDRFKAEYYQLEYRLAKLKEMVDKWDKGTLDFEPTCNRVTYVRQIHAMDKYLRVLEERARVEEVVL